jgi:hypothetical protein
VYVRNRTGQDITILIHWSMGPVLKRDTVSLTARLDSLTVKRMRDYVQNPDMVLCEEPFTADRVHSVKFPIRNAKGACITAVDTHDDSKVYCRNMWVPGGRRITIIPGLLKQRVQTAAGNS